MPAHCMPAPHFYALNTEGKTFYARWNSLRAAKELSWFFSKTPSSKAYNHISVVRSQTISFAFCASQRCDKRMCKFRFLLVSWCLYFTSTIYFGNTRRLERQTWTWWQQRHCHCRSYSLSGSARFARSSDRDPSRCVVWSRRWMRVRGWRCFLCILGIVGRWWDVGGWRVEMDWCFFCECTFLVRLRRLRVIDADELADERGGRSLPSLWVWLWHLRLCVGARWTMIPWEKRCFIRVWGVCRDGLASTTTGENRMRIR